ncbi:MAG: PA14 domain-containing protein [Planctomycetota bacterium]
MRQSDRWALPDGRAAIVLTDWGPYDWTYPYVQPLECSGARHTYRLLGPDSLTSVAVLEGEGALDLTFDKRLPRFPTGPDGLAQGVVSVAPRTPGRVTPYALIVRARGNDLPVSGVLLALTWDVSWFQSLIDPRQDRAAWLTASASPVGRGQLPELRLEYGAGGPAALTPALGLEGEVEQALQTLGADRFGTLARTRVTLPAGRWRIASRSDDGIRVAVDGDVLIDDWTWHAPKDHDATFEITEEREVEIAVEHFELDGYSTLSVTLEPAGALRSESR